MTDLQLAPANPAGPASRVPSGPDDRADDATLRRLLRGSVFDTWSRAAGEPPAPDRARRPAAGHCRFTMHYED